MNESHLTVDDIEQYDVATPDARTAQHLAACATCRARLARARRVDTALRAISRAPTPPDLAARIDAAVQARAAQEQAPLARAPLIAVATIFSALLVVWFGFEMLIAFEDKSALEFISWIFSHPELFERHFGDTLLAVIEIIPFSEILLTLFALFTVVVLAQQWVEATLAPRPRAWRDGRGS